MFLLHLMATSQFKVAQERERQRIVQALVRSFLGVTCSEKNFRTAEDFCNHNLTHHTFPDTNSVNVASSLSGISGKLELNSLPGDHLEFFQVLLTDIRRTSGPGTDDALRFLMEMSRQPAKVSRQHVHALMSERGSELRRMRILREAIANSRRELLDTVKQEMAVIADEADIFPSSGSESEHEPAGSSRSTSPGRYGEDTNLADWIMDDGRPTSLNPIRPKNLHVPRSRDDLYSFQLNSSKPVSMDILRVSSNVSALHGGCPKPVVAESWVVWDCLHMLLGVSTILFDINQKSVCYTLAGVTFSHTSPGSVESSLVEIAKAGTLVLDARSVPSPSPALRNALHAFDCDVVASIEAFKTPSAPVQTILQLLNFSRKYAAILSSLTGMLTPSTVERERISCDVDSPLLDQFDHNVAFKLSGLRQDVFEGRTSTCGDVSRLKEVVSFIRNEDSSGDLVETLHSMFPCNLRLTMMTQGLQTYHPIERHVKDVVDTQLSHVTLTAESMMLKIFLKQSSFSHFLRALQLVFFIDSGELLCGSGVCDALKSKSVPETVARCFSLTVGHMQGKATRFDWHVDRSDILARVIPDSALDQYGKTLKLLFVVHELNSKLKNMPWKVVNQAPLELQRRLGLVRFEMYSFISTTEQFLRLSVIRPAVLRFVKAIDGEIQSVPDLVSAHSAHLHEVVRGCMLSSEYSIVLDSLWAVLDTCNSYSQLITRLEEEAAASDLSFVTDAPPTMSIDHSTVADEVSAISVKFQKKLGQFTSLLTAQSIVYNSTGTSSTLLQHLRRFT